MAAPQTPESQTCNLLCDKKPCQLAPAIVLLIDGLDGQNPLAPALTPQEYDTAASNAWRICKLFRQITEEAVQAPDFSEMSTTTLA